MFHKTEFIWVVQPKQFSNLWKSAKENHSSLAVFLFLWQEGANTHTGTAQPLHCLTDLIQQYKFNSLQEWAQDHISIWSAKTHGVYACCGKTDNAWSDSKASSWNANPSTFWNGFEARVWVRTVSAHCITWLRHFWSRDHEIRLIAKTQTCIALLLLLLLTISSQFLAWKAGKERLSKPLFRLCCLINMFFFWVPTQPSNWAREVSCAVPLNLESFFLNWNGV